MYTPYPGAIARTRPRGEARDTRETVASDEPLPNVLEGTIEPRRAWNGTAALLETHRSHCPAASLTAASWQIEIRTRERPELADQRLSVVGRGTNAAPSEIRRGIP